MVSPLIALMKDQVEQLRTNGVPALFLNSTLSPEAYYENMESIRRGEVKLLYVAPETLLTPRIFSLLDSVQLSLLTIDEAHCISEWGHDFRPEYRQLADVRKRYPNATCLALTATATHRVRSDIKTSLGFSQSSEFIASFDRPNLFIEVASKRDPLNQTIKFLQNFKDQSGIIYCFTRRQVEELATFLSQKGFSVRPYHGGMEDDQRHRNQDAFIRDDVQIIVATIAFGMGINKPNIRFVLHYDLPKSIEGYYQEIGRAGRDGLPAHCLLLYNPSDAIKLRYLVNKAEGIERQSARQHLDAMVHYAEDDSTCRRKPLLAYFGEKYLHAKCSNCDNCKAPPPSLEDVTLPSQKLLSCVFRTGGKFSITHNIKVLRGTKDETILMLQHDKLSTFGIGAEWGHTQWQHLARQLIQMGYLNKHAESFTVSISDSGMEVLKKRKTIFGQVKETETKEKVEAHVIEVPEHNHALFALLRQKRKEIADQSKLPPYAIFSDRSLLEMATYYPQTQESFLNISGVGQVKAHQYGDVFLNLIKSYSQKKGLPEKTKSVKREKSEVGRRFINVAEAYNAGETIPNLMKQYGVSLGTILDHLTRYAAASNKLRSGDDLLSLSATPPNLQKEVFLSFNELGATLLKPVFERFNGKLSYDELKVLRVIWHSTSSK